MYYVGSTQNVQRRLIEHNSGKTKSLRGKGPFHIIYTEAFESRIDAVQRERQIKSYKGGTALKKLIGE
jgi:putative endonuclease